jgi:hypothetical protein
MPKVTSLIIIRQTISNISNFGSPFAPVGVISHLQQTPTGAKGDIQNNFIKLTSSRWFKF